MPTSRAVPPLPAPTVPMSLSDGGMDPVWRQFWLNLLAAIADAQGAINTPAYTLGNYANDAAAAAGGVGIGQLYRTANAVQIRLV